MRILVIGNGAREHALAYSLSSDPRVSDVHVSPGNAGMTGCATIHPDADPVELAKQLQPELVVIGPEIPLVAGLADMLRAEGFSVFGPSKEAAQIEGSKAFAKDIMLRAGVKTARAQSLEPGARDEDIDAALAHFGPTFVVKDDGLAGGKGVVVTEDREAAVAHIKSVHQAGNPVLLESFLEGPEISLFCLVDGTTVVPLLPAQDHKRVGNNDEGPNTGGMGAYTPLPWLPADGVETIVNDVVKPVAEQMAEDGVPFSGLLYAGLAWGAEGPAVVEFNCRFGDPETQAVLDLLETPLAGVLSAVAEGTLDQLPPLEWKDGYALTVVLAAEGYPESPKTGAEITGAEPGSEERGIRAAGVAEKDGKLVSAGGRVLNVIARGETLEEARHAAYRVLDTVDLPGGHYRTDIALPAVEGRIEI
ncbi:phosphoribosylamine--glycine ligase [Corynebacterium sp. zg254]|uniref:Phosphoribosylamine--glycine ligase n=1 Tax=Corynebacterium zhongnanshanii TaxID=2768834 RepID=A0ABQ6VC44_9CORY|nr:MULTISPECIES: phosphoribosylamine--glycine ligase [Corynebacterium]KAB3519809.1 phosphoribosylamine--glycine ligase [Corynebacterium zhongnanshanii]MCR5914738.1 phosphoribosylamine--glycine ligase [Corynebacterium sp. zg254]